MSYTHHPTTLSLKPKFRTLKTEQRIERNKEIDKNGHSQEDGLVTQSSRRNAHGYCTIIHSSRHSRLVTVVDCMYSNRADAWGDEATD